MSKRYKISHLADIEAAPCPCGFSRRAFMDDDNETASIHLVDIKKDSQTHYHKKLTEIYLVLEGEGQIELDGELFPLKPMTAVLCSPTIGLTPATRRRRRPPGSWRARR